MHAQRATMSSKTPHSSTERSMGQSGGGCTEDQPLARTGPRPAKLVDLDGDGGRQLAITSGRAYTPPRQRRMGKRGEGGEQSRVRHVPSKDGRAGMADAPTEGRVIRGRVLGHGKLCERSPAGQRRRRRRRLVREGIPAVAEGRGVGGDGDGAVVVDVGAGGAGAVHVVGVRRLLGVGVGGAAVAYDGGRTAELGVGRWRLYLEHGGRGWLVRGRGLRGRIVVERKEIGRRGLVVVGMLVGGVLATRGGIAFGAWGIKQGGSGSEDTNVGSTKNMERERHRKQQERAGRAS
ncbi:hypothetical protein BD413DRAFT_158666 [Trametes elegans]|nr:hypothetical protein BD413DRAFT_158666 [Trametes elegans]